MDEERWQESLNARNTQAANQAVYAAWSAIWTAEATEDIINIYKYFTSRGQRCPYTFQSVEAFSRWTTMNSADVAIYDGPLGEAFFALICPHGRSIHGDRACGPDLVRVGSPRRHSARPRPFQAASAGLCVPGHVVRPAVRPGNRGVAIYGHGCGVNSSKAGSAAPPLLMRPPP